jgi:tRNA threonylcarbamoyladenosine biosynthesis protein TsaB
VNRLTVLGLDTSTSATSVALRLPDGSVRERRDDPSAGSHPGHATRLLAMARELLAEGSLGWGDLDRLAVGVGPGTFTGLRVGVATARGLAQSLCLPLVGVSSLRALARPALGAGSNVAAAGGAALDEDFATSRRVLAIIDARRGEVFAAGYAARAQGAEDELSEPRALPPQGIAGLLAEIEAAGAAGSRGAWLAVGDGAVRYRSELERAGAEVPADSSALHRVRASEICALAAALSAGAGEPPSPVLPDYRRRPDAELTLERAGDGRVRV